MKKKKNIGIVAHDNRKKDIMEWVAFNWKELRQHDLICTGTTGKLVEDALKEKCEEHGEVPPTVTRLKSGPLGGDQQLGAMICEGKVDILIFFWDPMQPQATRCGCKSLASYHGSLQHPNRFQPFYGRFYGNFRVVSRRI